EYSSGAELDLTVVRGETFTRIEVSSPDEAWARAPEPQSPDPEQIGGWGLFLVEQLSDRWGTSDADCTVWFEFDHPAWPLGDVWTLLQRMLLPATRDQIVAAARAAAVPTSVVSRVLALESDWYKDVDAVS